MTMEETKPGTPGSLTLVWSASPEVSERRMFEFVNARLTESKDNGDEPLSLLIVSHGSSRALAAQRALAGSINTVQKVALVQPSFPHSKPALPFLRDYLTNSRSRKFDGVVIDGGSITFENQSSLRDFSNGIKELVHDLNIPGYLFVAKPQDVIEGTGALVDALKKTLQ